MIRELNTWHAIIEHGRKEWGINLHENPVHLVKRPPAGKARDRRLEPTDGEGMTEEDWLLAACGAETDVWMKPIVRIAIETAMRQGEILALKWDDIDFGKSVVTIRKSKNDGMRNDRTEGRVVPLSTRAKKVLQDLPRHMSGLVFPVDQNAFKMRFRRCVDRAGLSGLRFHDLRHEGTSRLFERGLDMMEVASITGHKSLAMLKRYTHLHAPTLAKKFQLFERASACTRRSTSSRCSGTVISFFSAYMPKDEAPRGSRSANGSIPINPSRVEPQIDGEYYSQFVSIADAAALLGVSRWTVGRMLEDGEIPHIRPRGVPQMIVRTLRPGWLLKKLPPSANPRKNSPFSSPLGTVDGRAKSQ